jgi:hypothetical protein
MLAISTGQLYSKHFFQHTEVSNFSRSFNISGSSNINMVNTLAIGIGQKHIAYPVRAVPAQAIQCGAGQMVLYNKRESQIKRTGLAAITKA